MLWCLPNCKWLSFLVLPLYHYLIIQILCQIIIIFDVENLVISWWNWALDKVNSCLTGLAVILLNEIESLSVAFHLIIDIHSKVREAIKKKRQKKLTFVNLGLTPPLFRKSWQNFFLSFLKLDHIWGNFGKILFFPPWRSKTLRKISSWGYPP